MERNFADFIKLNIHLSYDLTVLLLGIYLRNKNICPQKRMLKNVHRNFVYEPQNENNPNINQQGTV